VQVGEQPRAGEMGRPEQSQVEVHVGEQLMGLPAQSQVAVHVGEQEVMALPAQSHVGVQVGEQRAATVGTGVGTSDFCVDVGAAAAAGPASPPCTSCWKSLWTSGSEPCWAISAGGVAGASAAPACFEPSGPMASTMTSLAFLQAPRPASATSARRQQSLGKLEFIGVSKISRR
jgi:hypothetical protein